jgi:hypothetical protein
VSRGITWTGVASVFSEIGNEMNDEYADPANFSESLVIHNLDC